MMTVHSERIAGIECKFDADPRLIAGAAAIVAYAARRAGLADAAASDMSSATIKACDAIARTLQRNEKTNARFEIQLAVSAFPDRVEATINSAPGQLASDAAMPPEQSRLATEEIRQVLKSVPVDAVQVETVNGYPAVTLIKSCGKAERRFAS